MRVQQAGRRARKSPIELPEICFLQKPVGAFQVVDLRQSPRLDQPVLQHSVHPFHPPFDLRAVGQNQFHPQRRQRPAKLRWPFFPGQLIRHARRAFSAIKAVPIHRQAARQPGLAPPASNTSSLARVVSSSLNRARIRLVASSTITISTHFARRPSNQSWCEPSSCTLAPKHGLRSRHCRCTCLRRRTVRFPSTSNHNRTVS